MTINFKEEENGSVGELSEVCSQIVLKCPYLARIGRLDTLMVREQTCSCSYKIDYSVWQTFSTLDLVHSSHTWVPTILLCGKHSTTMRIRIVSRPWFCRRPWSLKVNIRWNSVHFRKANICANKLDVQETDYSFTQFNGSWSYFSWCRFTHGWNSRSRSLGISDWSVSFLTKSNQQNQRSEVAGKPVAKHHTPHEKPKIQHNTSIWIWTMLITFRQT